MMGKSLMKTKRFLAFLLALVLAVSTVPPASAASSDFKIDGTQLLKYTGPGGAVVIPSGITEISSSAFSGCATVTSVTIPNGVTAINSSAFSHCTNLASVTLPNSLTSIGYLAFSECTSLASINIPSSVAKIAANAFSKCSALTSVTIPYGVTEIGDETFALCTGLTNITIPNSVTRIGRGAFYKCTGLTSITIPQNVIEIGRSAFYGCTRLADVTILNKQTHIDGEVFKNTAWQKKMGDFAVVNGVLMAYEGKSTSVTIPNTVTTITPQAFYKSKVTSVIIPDSVTTIKIDAFLGCTSLTSVSIGSGVKKIEDYAFDGCTKLTNVTFSGRVADIGEKAFSGTPWLRNNGGSKGDFFVAAGTLISYTGKGGAVVVPNDVTVIGSGAFDGCDDLTSVTLPDSLTQIGDYAFRSTGLTSIIIPNGVTKIGDHAFDAAKLTSVAIPGSVSRIGSSAFAQCKNLTDVTISNGVTEIGNNAFEGCGVLKSASIPGSAVRIGDFAFQNCRELTGVIIPDGVAMIGDYAFRGCGSLTGIAIPNSVTRIGNGAFTSCNKLKKLTIPSSGIELGAWVFSGTDLSASTWKTIYGLMLSQWINPAALVKPQSERITMVSNQITAGLTTDYEKTKAICQWVCRNIKYNYKYYYSSDMDWAAVTVEPEQVLDTRLTVCAGYSRLTEALLLAQGIPAQYVSGRAKGAKGWAGHAWNEAYVDGRWILIDTTWGMNYFDMNVSSFSQKHHPYVRASFAEEDIPTSWAKAEVLEAMKTGLIPGNLQAAYRSAITREDFCRLMTTLVEKSVGTDITSYAASKGLTITNPFTDTDNPDVLAAHALGIVNGTSATTFNPKGSITRQEAAAMLARTGRLLGLASGQGVSFTDAGKFASWAGNEISFVSGLVDPVNNNRVMNGVSANEFNPQGAYTREQAVMTALRLFHCAV